MLHGLYLGFPVFLLSPSHIIEVMFFDLHLLFGHTTPHGNEYVIELWTYCVALTTVWLSFHPKPGVVTLANIALCTYVIGL